MSAGPASPATRDLSDRYRGQDGGCQRRSTGLDVVALAADSSDDDAGPLLLRLMDVRSSLVAGMLGPTADALGTVDTD